MVMNATDFGYMSRLGTILLFLRRACPKVLVALIAIVAFPVNSCAPLNNDPTPMTYVCGTSDERAFRVIDDHVSYGDGTVCGEGDPNLPPEPRLPTEVCQELVANKRLPETDFELPSEENLDTQRLQDALLACKGQPGAVKLVADGKNGAFVSGPLILDSVKLWIDDGVTLYQSRQAPLFQKTGNCGKLGVNDSDACVEFLQVTGTEPAIVGDGTIDGQGGEPLYGEHFSWWELSEALRSINGSIGNPQMINLKRGTTGFLLYRVHLQNASKFHVKITSNPTDGVCDAPGEGYTVWGVTIVTPSKAFNSQGLIMTPHFARNSDAVDPGTTSTATCGVVACNTITTGDDQIAIKGGHLVKNLIIAHNHFGTGHGMSIGSETYGTDQTPDGETARGVQDVYVYDLTIDADSRAVGYNATPADFNGIRIKTDISRGGVVDNIVYEDICMRDMTNAILISTAYNPLFSGEYYPEYGRIEFRDVRHVQCMNTTASVVTIEGHSDARKAGPVVLDNVVIDNMGPPAYFAEYANIEIGPGGTNFDPSGNSVSITDNSSGTSTPKNCVFPTLPAPALPEGWLR